MQISRESLLYSLEAVIPGLSTREAMEQSSSFVFKDGQVHTFNDEVFCSHRSDLNGVEGAVPAAPLLSVLRKLSEPNLKVRATNDELLLKGDSGREMAVTFEREIFLPIDKVEKPGRWRKLSESFSEAIKTVGMCASKDESRYMLMCVHIHPEWVEACDNYHLCRYTFRTGVKKSCFIKRDSIKHMVDLGMTHFSETESWMHFKNPSGMVLSCRRVVDQDYPDLGPILETHGSKTVLPKGLAEAADRASIFSSENVDESDRVVKVEIRKGKLRISGQGVTGWYREMKDLKYRGRQMTFLISPDLLSRLVKTYNDCEISEDYLRVDGESYVYVTCLGRENAKDDSQNEEE